MRIGVTIHATGGAVSPIERAQQFLSSLGDVAHALARSAARSK